MIGVIAKAIDVFGITARLEVSPPPDMGAEIQQLAQQFASIAGLVLSTVDSTVIQVTRLAYVSVLLIGVFLYFTRVEKRFGKDLIKGGILLAVLSEVVFPMVSRV